MGLITNLCSALTDATVDVQGHFNSVIDCGAAHFLHLHQLSPSDPILGKLATEALKQVNSMLLALKKRKLIEPVNGPTT